jgi:hypothetical protein
MDSDFCSEGYSDPNSKAEGAYIPSKKQPEVGWLKKKGKGHGQPNQRILSEQKFVTIKEEREDRRSSGRVGFDQQPVMVKCRSRSVGSILHIHAE